MYICILYHISKHTVYPCAPKRSDRVPPSLRQAFVELGVRGRKAHVLRAETQSCIHEFVQQFRCDLWCSTNI